MVQPQRLGGILQHQLPGSVADVEESVDDHLELPVVEAFGRLRPASYEGLCRGRGDDDQHCAP